MNTAVIIETLLVDLLVHRSPLPPLFPSSTWRPSLTADIENLEAPACIKAALFTWNDDLDHAHHLVQNLRSPESAYWHAIIHRREKDFSNAQYWTDRVGEHPIHKTLRSHYPHWTPSAYLKTCRSVVREIPRLNQPLEGIQADEMGLLLAHCLCAADSHPLMHTISHFQPTIVSKQDFLPAREG